MTDEKLLEEYSKEIYGNYPSSSGNPTVAQLKERKKAERKQCIEDICHLCFLSFLFIFSILNIMLLVDALRLGFNV